MNNSQRQRRALTGLVHKGTRRLFEDEVLRRDWQEKHTGKRSCSSMNNADLQKLVAILRKKSALEKIARAKTGNKQSRFIYALWNLLFENEVVYSKKGIEAWLENRFGYQKAEFLPRNLQSKAISQLQKWCISEGLKWK